ncbi:MAG: Exodeoxyribonuclease III [Alphaproteobacteria bacterium MarineAlpha9_Bin7]|nr:MAG: Exodeoxyribonuclease III [Alphaproteobacteria bacterium MarineAlpha9_Bin7]
MRIATWNVNSIRARLPNVIEWLGKASPDVVLLQEVKTVAENFPTQELEELGFNCAVVGQKSYNGVAILSRFPIQDIIKRLPGDSEDNQARYIEAWIDAGSGGVRVASIYLPNGNPTSSPKYPYKLAWMDRLQSHASHLLTNEEAVVLGGDYNVVPSDDDVYDPKGWEGDALCRPETRARFRAILYLGYTEAFRALNAENGHYTFWDYQSRAFESDRGLRIDHFLLSPQAADRLKSCEIDLVPRGRTKASDHTPVLCELTN